MTDGTSQGLFIVVAIVIFGIFVVLAYILFEDTLSPALASMFADVTEKYSSNSETFTEGYFQYEYMKSGTEVKIVGYIGHLDGVTDVVIPEQIAGTTVTTIANNSFNYRGLTSVVLPNTLKVIEDGSHYAGPVNTGAFSNNHIDYVKFPASMTYIGQDAFAKNPLKNGVDFGEGEKLTLGNWSFWANQMETLHITERVENLNMALFEGSEKLKTVQIDGHRTGSFGGFIFYVNDLQGTFNIPEGFTVVGDYSLSKNPNLKEIRIPSTVKKLGNNIVFQNLALEKVHLPEHLREQVESNPNIFRRHLNYTEPVNLVYY